jgi:hypothetical protein
MASSGVTLRKLVHVPCSICCSAIFFRYYSIGYSVFMHKKVLCKKKKRVNRMEWYSISRRLCDSVDSFALRLS